MSYQDYVIAALQRSDKTRLCAQRVCGLFQHRNRELLRSKGAFNEDSKYSFNKAMLGHGEHGRFSQISWV